jgi:hypothetical protein
MLVRCLANGGSIFSGAEASGKPGVVQIGIVRQSS